MNRFSVLETLVVVRSLDSIHGEGREEEDSQC
jgi:hypothetical protein